MSKSIISKEILKKNKNTTLGKYLKSMTEHRKKFEKEYKEFLISEMLIAAMEHDDISVRELAKEAGVSPAIVQALRSGTKKNVTIKTFSKIFNKLGYNMLLEKNGELLPIDASKL